MYCKPMLIVYLIHVKFPINYLLVKNMMLKATQRKYFRHIIFTIMYEFI